MTSRNWKDRREKESFLQQLREFQTAASQLEEFDDDYDWDYGDLDDDWNDEPDDRYRYRYLDLDDDLDSPGFDDVKPLPGWHVRLNGVPYLVLRNGKWANMLTGETSYGAPWIDRESVIFGL